MCLVDHATKILSISACPNPQSPINYVNNVLYLIGVYFINSDVSTPVRVM